MIVKQFKLIQVVLWEKLNTNPRKNIGYLVTFCNPLQCIVCGILLSILFAVKSFDGFEPLSSKWHLCSKIELARHRLYGHECRLISRFPQPRFSDTSCNIDLWFWWDGTPSFGFILLKKDGGASENVITKKWMRERERGRESYKRLNSN